MKLFSTAYERVLRWSKHPKAPYFLAGLSFAESSFFPVPPDVMLISMGLAKRFQVWRYAFITTIFSVLGGLLGYFIGVFFFHIAFQFIQSHGLMYQYETIRQWFEHWGIWIVLVAGFSPIPYKLFTITAGSMHMMLLPFIVASIFGRGGRFFLVALMIFLGGEQLEKKLYRYIEPVGWLVVILLIAFMIRQYITS